MNKEEILHALKELRKFEKRNFNQTVDFIINLKEFDIKRESVNTSAVLPHSSKKGRIFAFLEKPNTIFDKVIVKKDFDVLNSKSLKKSVKDYDFCVASAKLMPDIAKRFGKILGPTGKMPDPKAGCVIMNEDDKIMSALSERLRKLVKIKAKDNSIKTAVGKEDMKDDEIAENCIVIYNTAISALPKKFDNIKNVMLKFTMSKPIKIMQKKGESDGEAA